MKQIKEINKRDLLLKRIVAERKKTNEENRIFRQRKVVSRNQRPQVKKPRLAVSKINLLDGLVKSKSPSVQYPIPDWFKTTFQPDVSVIIPLYKSQRVIADLINSWDLHNDGLKVELIFVDDKCPNNSKEIVIKTFESRRQAIKNGIGQIICNVENKGYSGACNAGADAAKGKYIVYLNADTKLTDGWIKPIYDLFESDTNIGIIGNLQIKEGGTWNNSIDGAGSQWLWNHNSFLHIGRHVFNFEELPHPFMLDKAPPEIFQVAEREMVTGCCLAIRADVNKNLGGYNPNFRIGYWEDSDLCLSVREKGYKIMYQPNSMIYHKLGHTNSGRHSFQDYNRNFFANKWINSGRIDSLVADKRKKIPPVHQILLQRKGAQGDVLAASYLVSALKKKYPGSKISFFTECKQVLDRHPDIDYILTTKPMSEDQYQLIYNLDDVYEHRPFTNILESYGDVVGLKQEECKPYIYVEDYQAVPKKYIVIHPGRTAWVGRDWSHENFSELANKFTEIGYSVVCIGSSSDHKINCNLDLRGKTNINQTASVIQKADFFIGIDSFPMHIAQAVNTPGLCFFGSIDPSTRLYRPNMKSIQAQVSCLGCHHRRPRPSVVTNVCETGQLECIKQLSVDNFWHSIKEQLLSGR